MTESTTHRDAGQPGSQSTAQLPDLVDRDAAIFTISVAANLAGMHPQTLRTYDRLGLVRPRRSRGRGRRYSPRDVARLRLVQHLTQDEGINLQGVQRILDLEAEIESLNGQLEAAAEQLRELRSVLTEVDPTGRRVFTAESSGAVHLGRVLRRQAALPPRAS